MIEPVALLLCATLFGGMALYSFGFAAFVFRTQAPDVAGRMLRQAFPPYYLFVTGCAALAALVLVAVAPVPAAVMAAVALATVYARQILMPQINAARDAQLAGDATAARRFGWLHGASVALQLLQLAATGWVITGFA